MAAIGGDLKAAEPYWDDENYCAQEKLDGARYILHKDMEGRVRAYSRQISTRTGQPVDKTAQLEHLVAEFNRIAPNGTVIDGEVCAPGLSSSNLVTRVTGSKPERAYAVQKEHGFLVYHAFDCLAYGGEVLTDRTLFERFVALGHAVMPPSGSVHGTHHFIDFLPYYVGEDAKRELYDKVVAKGGEGIILKHFSETYHQGERHKAFVKVKRQKTYDVVFMGIVPAEETSVKKGEKSATVTRIAGKAGAIKYGQIVVKPAYTAGGIGEPSLLLSIPESRELTLLGTVGGFDDATRDEISVNTEKYVGRVFEVLAQEQFSSGALRHPRFVQWRDDKNAEDCVFRKDEG